MRSYPLQLVEEQLVSAQSPSHQGRTPAGMLVTSMLDLPTYRGILSSHLCNPLISESQRQSISHLLSIPTAIYFHENQLSYPIAPHAREDSHYGYTNILSAMMATEIWFNSQYHLENFLTHAADLIGRMPDGHSMHQISDLEKKSLILPPGFRPVDPTQITPEPSEPSGKSRSSRPSKTEHSNRPLRIGWVARWEYDKRPDQFLRLVELMESDQFEFELVLLGVRGNRCDSLRSLETRYSERILINHHAETLEAYHRALGEMDIVVSTADHEFFGIGICEAISAGAIPVLPNRLSYPELAPDSCLYESIEHAKAIITGLSDPDIRLNVAAACQVRIEKYRIETCITKLDEAFEHMISRA